MFSLPATDSSRNAFSPAPAWRSFRNAETGVSISATSSR
jgi:hypothetical protein